MPSVFLVVDNTSLGGDFKNQNQNQDSSFGINTCCNHRLEPLTVCLACANMRTEPGTVVPAFTQ